VLLAHMCKRGLHRPERGPEPGVQRPGKHVVGLLLEWHEWRVALSVVHEDVESPFGIDGRLDHALDVVTSADVDVEKTGSSSELGIDLVCRPLAVFGLRLGDRDATSLAREAARNASTDPHPGTSHDRHAIREPVSHRGLPSVH
jgi:hypothetical protein